jgi:hypothetical protein
MSSDFEKRLDKLTIRPTAAEWRDEIMRAARTPPGSVTSDVAPPWWREWLWPCPKAWLGLAAAWGIVLLLQTTEPSEPGEPNNAAPVTWQTFAQLQKEAESIAQSEDVKKKPSITPQSAMPQPATRRRSKVNIG